MVKKLFFTGLVVMACCGVALAFIIDHHVLPISSRCQWNHSYGYCGSCSIQMSGLYYGAYLSQNLGRESVGNKELLVGELMYKALDRLGFTYQPYMGEQMDAYLSWIQSCLSQNYPVIVSTLHAHRTRRELDQDHIMVVVGYCTAGSFADPAYDMLIYNDCHRPMHLYQTVKNFQNNQKHNYFGSDKQMGIAVTGVKDDENILVPVRLVLDGWREPYGTHIIYKVKIIISSLKPGKPYLLLKYSDYKKVPSRAFREDHECIFRAFIPRKSTMEFHDRIRSDATAIFRCMPDR